MSWWAVVAGCAIGTSGLNGGSLNLPQPFAVAWQEQHRWADESGEILCLTDAFEGEIRSLQFQGTRRLIGWILDGSPVDVTKAALSPVKIQFSGSGLRSGEALDGSDPETDFRLRRLRQSVLPEKPWTIGLRWNWSIPPLPASRVPTYSAQAEVKELGRETVRVSWVGREEGGLTSRTQVTFDRATGWVREQQTEVENAPMLASELPAAGTTYRFMQTSLPIKSESNH